MSFPMEDSNCSTCRKPKALLECGICKDSVCKNCAQFLDENSFSFMDHVPAELSHGVYCTPCFDAKVAPELLTYNELMERAKEIHVFEKDQGKETRFFRRMEKAYKVDHCADREEALLRLAFFAAQRGFNTLVDVHITSTKVRNGTYQTQVWQGTGVPTTVDEARLNRKSNIRSPSR